MINKLLSYCSLKPKISNTNTLTVYNIYQIKFDNNNSATLQRLGWAKNMDRKTAMTQTRKFITDKYPIVVIKGENLSDEVVFIAEKLWVGLEYYEKKKKNSEIVRQFLYKK